jgi:hypothetical protein
MTSFCDLTIMQLANDSVHRQNFGEFGIGLTKDWGVRNKVSPVMYAHRTSQQTKRLNKLINVINDYRNKGFSSKAVDIIEAEMIDSFKFIKPYKGIYHKGKKIKNGTKAIVYYNEREWRYCPSVHQYSVLRATIPDNKQEKEKLNRKLREDLIKFETKDVKFIVIKGKKDFLIVSKTINDMVDLDDTQKSFLLTKIISFEEIREDYG